jgi:hypothetical protein
VGVADLREDFIDILPMNKAGNDDCIIFKEKS